jgi:hypothetical protein
MIPKMAPEAKQDLLVQMQARIMLQGMKPADREVYEQAVRLLKEENNGK